LLRSELNLYKEENLLLKNKMEDIMHLIYGKKNDENNETIDIDMDKDKDKPTMETNTKQSIPNIDTDEDKIILDIEEDGGKIAGSAYAAQFLNEQPIGLNKYKNPQQKYSTDPASVQEYLCRDCKRSFCRKGDRDNHERTQGHTRWQHGAKMSLTLEKIVVN